MKKIIDKQFRLSRQESHRRTEKMSLEPQAKNIIVKIKQC